VNQDRYRLANNGLLIVLSLSALLAMVGCAHRPAQIIPVSNLDVAALSTEDIVQVMLQAGFSDKQIVEFGTDLRNELARSGAAQINVRGKVEAIFAVHGDYVYVSSYLKGSFIYDLTKESVINDQFTFVPVTVKAVNDKPKANDDSATTQEDRSVPITLIGNDPDGDPLTYSVVTGPSHGKLSGTAPNLIYTPNANFNGSDSFTFNVNDGTMDSVSATVSITVTPVNDPPVANDDSATTLEDIPIVKIDVLANDTDVDNDRLTVTTVTQGTNGSVTINSDNTLTYTTYTPNANFYGTDAFTYTVWDSKSGTDTGTVHVTINGINDKPVIRSTAVTTATVGELYAYDVDAKDIEGDTLTYSLATKPAGMTIDPATGLIEWTPTNANLGTNDVVVKVTDSNDSDSVPVSDTQLFTITVEAISSPQTLFIVDGYDQRGKKTLSAAGKTNVVQASDNDRWETKFGSYISYDFSDVPIPPGATITSAAVYVEHFEQERFTSGKLQWSVGTGWPSNPVVWASISAQVNEGEQNEEINLWDVTSFVDTPKKVNALQLQVKNNDNIARRKTLVDYIYVVVKWNYNAADEKKKL
jgi:VCBS repeat-containing protein